MLCARLPLVLKFTLTRAAIVLLFGSLPGMAVVLVDSGVSVAPIIVFADAPEPTRAAAVHLADYIEKSSGARPEIIEGVPDSVPPQAIWVGYQPLLDGLFPDVDFDFEHPEEILIAVSDNHLALVGRDRWNPGQTEITLPNRWGTIDVQLEYGTANAVYTFLQDYLGVRWLWPGQVDILKQPSIAFEPFEYRYHPQIRMRHRAIPSLDPYRIGGRAGSPGGDWARFNRLQLDSLVAPIQGHAFGDWWQRFHESNPEFFALQPDGSRDGFPGGSNAKLCESNPGVWQQWLKDVEAIIAENPNQTVFTVAANDSWASGHCICEDCRAWDEPDGEQLRFRWRGLSQDYVALSDRQIRFANNLARLLKERFPDKDYDVVMLSYGLSRPPPVKAVPDDNVIVASVANFLLRTDGDIDRHESQFKGWAQASPRILFRPNIGNPAGWQVGGPGDTSRTMEQLRMVAEHGCIGLNFDMVWMFWATQGPTYYLIAQMAWNPFIDGNAVMADYFARAFGPAAADVSAYWDHLQTIRNRMLDGTRWSDAFDADAFATGYALLDAAAAKVAGNSSDDYAYRVAFFRAGFDFLRYSTENRALIQRLRLSGGKDRDAYAAAMANWKKIEEINQNFPAALNANYLRNPASSRLNIIHPEYYNR